MIVTPYAQGTHEWVQARLGIPTASNFHRIITSKTLKVSEQSHGYLCELLAERMMRCQVSDAATQFMERGSALENQAVALYELKRDVDTTPVGLCLSDDGRVGCSPDRLVGEVGGLELKCPSAGVHVGYLLDGDEGVAAKYRAQVQGALWITERSWWDVCSYHPMMPEALVRVERDEELISALAEAVGHFLERLEAAEARLRDAGRWVESVAGSSDRADIVGMTAAWAPQLRQPVQNAGA
jgi:hypothetical protein